MGGRHRTAVDWVRLDPKSFSAMKAAVTLKKLDDLSIVASGKAAQGAYTVDGRDRSDADHRPPARSAARRRACPRAARAGARDGNFVLIEFELKAAPKADPEKEQNGQVRHGRRPTSARRTYPIAERGRRQPDERKRLGRLAEFRHRPLGDLRAQGADRYPTAGRS